MGPETNPSTISYLCFPLLLLFRIFLRQKGGGGREPDRYFLFFSFPSLLLLLLFCDEFFGKKRSTGALVPYHSVGTFRLRFHFFANLWPRY